MQRIEILLEHQQIMITLPRVKKKSLTLKSKLI